MTRRRAEPPPASDPLWQQGWYRFAHRIASPNFGPRPAGASIDLVVVHSISLPPGVYGGDEVLRLFTNQLDWNAHPYFKQPPEIFPSPTQPPDRSFSRVLQSERLS